MRPTIRFDTEKGINRLLSAPADVKPRPKSDDPPRYQDATPEHRQLYSEYRRDIWEVHTIAVPWWEDTIQAQVQLGKNRQDAIDESFNRRVAGAAAHPHVVWVLRTYWLSCDALNREMGPERAVHPEVFLLRWLLDAGEEDLILMLACMPYWPIGLDENGNWC